MRTSSRSKVSFLLLFITALMLASAFKGTPVSYAASTTSTTASYQGQPLTGRQVATSPGLPTKVTKLAHPRTAPLDLDSLNPHENGALKKPASVQTTSGLPTTTGAAILGANVPEGKLIHNFNGLSNTVNDALNGFELTPPDQGLCVGSMPGGGPTVVVEPINLAIAVYTPSGKLLAEESLATLFADPNATGDVRCFYDAQSQAFYFSEIGFDPTGSHTVDDLAVLDSNGFATYQFDSSLGGLCFGDQPHVGYDTHNVYIATDEFCNVYEGALLIAISKPQLLQEVASPNADFFGPVSLGGDPIVTLQPGISGGIGTEYLLNSFPFDQFGNNNSISNTLGLWQVKGGQHVTTGGTVILTGKIITSEIYAFPQPAASTGTGAVTIVQGNPITSEAFLNPDDDRMQQVQVVKDGNGLAMYAAVNTAVLISGDPSARDGVAWFKINPASQTIEQQGYYAAAGSYMVYPTLFHANSGTTTLVFSITSPTLNPSSAYAVMKAGASSFGGVKITAYGAGPHLSFSDVEFSQARWGDYTASVLDPSGNNIWSAAEYIPPAAFQGAFDNWGTNVFEVAGD